MVRIGGRIGSAVRIGGSVGRGGARGYAGIGPFSVSTGGRRRGSSGGSSGGSSSSADSYDPNKAERDKRELRHFANPHGAYEQGFPLRRLFPDDPIELRKSVGGVPRDRLLWSSGDPEAIFERLEKEALAWVNGNHAYRNDRLDRWRAHGPPRPFLLKDAPGSPPWPSLDHPLISGSALIDPPPTPAWMDAWMGKTPTMPEHIRRLRGDRMWLWARSDPPFRWKLYWDWTRDVQREAARKAKRAARKAKRSEQ